MKKILIVLFMLSLSWQTASAQDAPPSEASINELMQVTNASSMMNAAMQQMDGMMRANFEQWSKGHPLSPEQKKIFDDMRAQMVAVITSELRWEKLAPTMIGVYRQVFTQKEVDGMLAFYKTEAGQAVIKKMPAVMQASMQSMQGMMAGLMPKLEVIQKDAVERLRAAEKKDKPQK